MLASHLAIFDGALNKTKKKNKKKIELKPILYLYPNDPIFVSQL